MSSNNRLTDEAILRAVYVLLDQYAAAVLRRAAERLRSSHAGTPAEVVERMADELDGGPDA